MPSVLIVDDSPTAREVLASIIESDRDLNVIGFAENGREAIEMAKSLAPDVITMDIHMPQLNGLEATQEIMIESPTPIVIISASARSKDVETTMQALRAGALTVLAKPVGPHAPGFAALAKEIVATVKAMSDVLVIRHRRRREPMPVADPSHSTADSISRAGDEASLSCSTKLRAIAIAASTGGPPALAKLLGALPETFPVPILMVQHIVPNFLSGFVTWLDSVVPLHVKTALDHETLRSGTVYVAPADRHLGVSKSGRVRLSDVPAIDGFRPAGTFLFTSVAESFHDKSAAVIMTGMGHDGVEGLKQLHAMGGHTIAQDEATCVVFGMPRAAVEANVVQTVLPLEEIAKHLVKLADVKA